MKAIRVMQNGETDVLQLQAIPMPKPQADEALVQIKVAGLNFIDIYQRRGRYQTALP